MVLMWPCDGRVERIGLFKLIFAFYRSENILRRLRVELRWGCLWNHLHLLGGDPILPDDIIFDPLRPDRHSMGKVATCRVDCLPPGNDRWRPELGIVQML